MMNCNENRSKKMSKSQSIGKIVEKRKIGIILSRASSRTNLFTVLAAHVTPPLILPPPAVLAAAISEGRYLISISRPAPSIYRAKASINEDYHSVSLCGRCRCLVCRAWRRSSSQSSSSTPVNRRAAQSAR
jgi:hypothetical protein